MKRKAIGLFTVILVLLCFASCSNNSSVPSTGSVSIVLNNNARGIEPNISLDTAKYSVAISGTGYSSVEDVATSVSVYSKKDIPEGNYTVTVSAINSAGIVIGEGSKEFSITRNNTTEVSVTVDEIAGNGKLTVTLSGTVIEGKTYTLNVYDSKDSLVKSVPFTDNVAELEIGNGYYYFTVSDGIGTVSDPEAFRMLKGDHLSAEAKVYSGGDGSFRLEITNVIKPTPELKLAFSSPNVHAGDSVTVSAVGMEGSTLTYSWFIDGVEAEGENGAAITFSKNVSGEYSIKCLVKDSASNLVWSADRMLTVYDVGYKPLTLCLQGNVEFWCVGDVLIPADLQVSVNKDSAELYSFQYGHGHRAFTFDKESVITCSLSGVDGYSYYLETETDGDYTVVYIVIDREIEDPAFVKVNFDYDYRFHRERNEYRGFYLCPEGASYRSEGSGIVSMTNNTASRIIKVNPGYYRQNGMTGNNGTLDPSVSPSNFTVASGETKEVTVTLPYATVVLEGFDGDAGYYGIKLGDYDVDRGYVDEMDGKKVILLPSGNVGYSHYSLWKAFNPDYRYDFSTTAGIGETQNVSTIKNEIDWIDSGVTIPAGRTLIRVTSAVVLDRTFQELYWKTVTPDGSLYDSGIMDLSWPSWINLNQSFRLYCTDITGQSGYKYKCSVEKQSDESGEYNLVTINIDKDMSDYATLKVNHSFDESLLVNGTYITARRNSDNKYILIPVYSGGSSEYKIEPGTYRSNGYWNSILDPQTGKEYAPRIPENFICTSGKTTELSVRLEERN